MPFGIAKVNVLLHGLFFLRKSGDNLEVLAPKVPGHHFIGGARGTRQELTGPQDLTNLGLVGKIGSGLGAPSLDDVDGSIMQFSTIDSGQLKPLTGPEFLGSILLPWPIKFGSLRVGKIATQFQPASNSNIGKKIVSNATDKGHDSLGVVILLQYTLPAGMGTFRSDASQVNIHFYLQPRDPHDVNDVNKDLAAVKNCFVNPAGFDLQMQLTKNIIPPQAIGNFQLGTTTEDEFSVDEELDQSPDIRLICMNDPPTAIIRVDPHTGQPNVSPANCPMFFVREGA